MERNLALIRADGFCTSYRVANPHLCTYALKVYKSIEVGKLTRYTKYLARKSILSDTDETNPKILPRLIGLSSSEWSRYAGKSFLVRDVEAIPFKCVATSRDVQFVNGKTLSFPEAEDVLRDWLIANEQYRADPEDFLLLAAKQVSAAFELISAHFSSRDLYLLYAQVDLGIENVGGDFLPVWIGPGVIPQTATIAEGEGFVEDAQYLAKIILPSDWVKEIGAAG